MKPIHLICAIVGGAIAGAAVGLLMAPDKGEDTRNKIIRFLKEKGIQLKKKDVDELVDEIEDAVEKHI